MSTAISVRIPDQLASKLTEISKETERPKSFHIQKALEAYLTELADIQVAIDRLHDTSDLVISIEDMRKELELEQDLPEKADTFPLLTGKFAGLRKFRIGDYRVIYTIIKNTALILRISHRRDAYR
jgi:RHH-type rel operon transcriptional repressor/antitoxin RelB